MRSSRARASAWFAAVLFGCNGLLNISDHELASQSSGGTAGNTSASSSGGSSSGGTASAGDTSDLGGAAGAGRGGAESSGGAGAAPAQGGQSTNGEGGEGGAPVTPSCLTGAKRCDLNIVMVCDALGSWSVAPEQCGGTTPACTGEGLCAGLRLREGTLDTFGEYPPEANGPTYVLVQQSLLTFSKTCGTRYCVTGGIMP